MSVPPVRSMPAKGVPTPLGRGFFSALGLTQRTRRETQRARVPWRPLRQRLCDLCVENAGRDCKASDAPDTDCSRRKAACGGSAWTTAEPGRR